METEGQKKRLSEIEKRLQDVHYQMVETLDQVCSLLKIGRLPASPLAGKKSLKAANKILDRMSMLRYKLKDLRNEKIEILEEMGRQPFCLWQEFWESLEGSVG